MAILLRTLVTGFNYVPHSCDSTLSEGVNLHVSIHPHLTRMEWGVRSAKRQNQNRFHLGAYKTFMASQCRAFIIELAAAFFTIGDKKVFEFYCFTIPQSTMNQ